MIECGGSAYIVIGAGEVAQAATCHVSHQAQRPEVVPCEVVRETGRVKTPLGEVTGGDDAKQPDDFFLFPLDAAPDPEWVLGLLPSLQPW